MKIRILFIGLCLLVSNFIYAQPTLANENTTLTMTGQWFCIPGGTPPSSGSGYTIEVSWTDFSGTPGNFTGPASILSTDVGTTSQIITVDAPTANFLDNNDEGYSFADIADVTTIIIHNPANTVHWTLTFSSSINTNCYVVPITLISFTAQAYNYGGNNIAKLAWTTGSESDVSRFVIERSKPNTSHWEKVAYVTPSNNPNGSSYIAYDYLPAQSNHYYRLKTEDIDGSTQYSMIRTLSGLTPLTQPAATACSYFIAGADGICNRGNSFYMLNDYPTYSNITWTKTQFYNYNNSALMFNQGENGVKLVELNDNVITLTASLTRCSSGGQIVKHIFQGTPPVSKNQVTNEVVDCNGTVTSRTAVVTITPFPGTTGSQYLWYVGGVYSGTGLQRSFNITGSQSYSYQIRFSGPCGLSTATGFAGSYLPPVEEYRIGPNPASDVLFIDLARPICPQDPPPYPPIYNKMTGVEIIDYSGNKVYQQTFKTPVSSAKINLRNVKGGNYRLRINYGKKFEIKQIKVAK